MAKLAASYEYTDAETLSLLREARVTVLVAGQEYEFRGKKFKRADLAEIESMINVLEAKISRSNNGAAKTLTRHART